MNAPPPPPIRTPPKHALPNHALPNRLSALHRRGLSRTPQRPGAFLRERAARRLVHPSYRRARPSDTGG